jgi:hypothetical protein
MTVDVINKEENNLIQWDRDSSSRTRDLDLIHKRKEARKSKVIVLRVVELSTYHCRPNIAVFLFYKDASSLA